MKYENTSTSANKTGWDKELLYGVIHGGEAVTCCERLLDIALKRGAPDNVTAVLIQYE